MRKYLDWQVAGVELSDFASTYARETLGLDVQTGTLETTRFSEGSFDVVTFWDVIEHVPNPLETLRRAYRLLRSDGLLVLRTPNLDSLDARVFGSYWIGYELPRHLYVFSRRTLERLLQKAGFCVVGIRCIYGSHAAAMSSVRFWLRDKAREWSGREVAERLLFSRLARLIAMPYFFVMDQLLLSSGPTLFCAKVDMK
jgi:SAM-dependent methyltransferase